MHDIRLRGARTHNLRGIDLDLRPGELTVVTGLSGAGKSSLAIDTLYSEGQRRFVESFSPYARQFLERLERPPIDELDPVAAAVAVDRRAPVKSSRSTVATMADLEPYLSALFARESTPVCPECDLPAAETDPVRAAQRSVEAHRDATAVVTYEVRVAGTEQYLDARERLAQAGYRRLWLGGEARDLDDVRPSDALGGEGSGALSVVVDRLRLQDDDARRLGAAIEEAWRQGHGAASLHIDPVAPAAAPPAASRAGRKPRRPVAPPPAAPTRVRLVRGLACPGCAREFAPPRPGLFSYQSPVGACAPCRGFGRTIGIDWAKVVPDERRTLAGGAIRPWSGSSTQWERRTLLKFCVRRGIPTDAAWASLTEAQRQEIRDGEGSWHGGKYPGLAAWFKWLESRTYKMHVRVLLARYRAYDPCAECGGKRLSRESLFYRVGGLDLAAWHALELREAHLRLRTLVTRTAQGEMARRILAERLAYLFWVVLGFVKVFM
jgi:excinuclease ABC subunit A